MGWNGKVKYQLPWRDTADGPGFGCCVLTGGDGEECFRRQHTRRLQQPLDGGRKERRHLRVNSAPGFAVLHGGDNNTFKFLKAVEEGRAFCREHN